MNVCYFPGCTLKTQGKKLDRTGRRVAQALGIHLQELEDWQCCGAVYPMAEDEIATRLSAVRALVAADACKQPLVTLCSACHHVIRRVNGDMQHNASIGEKVNRYLQLDPPYQGQTRVLHYIEMLRDLVGFDQIAKQVVRPLTGQKIGAYYGCMLLRPSREMEFDDPENPQIMEELIRALGAEPIVYAMRNECCGGYTTLENRAAAAGQAQKVVDNAKACGAHTLITACPLCLYNLQHNAQGIQVRYFTELMAQALGLEEDADAD